MCPRLLPVTVRTGRQILAVENPNTMRERAHPALATHAGMEAKRQLLVRNNRAYLPSSLEHNIGENAKKVECVWPILRVAFLLPDGTATSSTGAPKDKLAGPLSRLSYTVAKQGIALKTETLVTLDKMEAKRQLLVRNNRAPFFSPMGLRQARRVPQRTNWLGHCHV
jgi:hypothetical protein